MEEGTEDIVLGDIISDEIKLHAKSALSEKSKKIEKYFQFKDLSHSKVIDLLNKGYLKDVNNTYDMKRVVDEIMNYPAVSYGVVHLYHYPHL